MTSKIRSRVVHVIIEYKHFIRQTQLIGRPDDDLNKELLKIYIKNGTPPYINLAIGTRVSCTKTSGTQIGKYEN